jgi:hypothetical protein
MGGGTKKKLPSGKPDVAQAQADMLTAFLRGDMSGMRAAPVEEEETVVDAGLPSDPALGAAVLAGQNKAMGLGQMPTVSRTPAAPRAPRAPLATLINRPRTMVPGGRPKGL